MKKILLLALPLIVMCFASCEKEEEWTDDSPIIQFKDPRLLEAILSIDRHDDLPHIDKNADGQISEKEASVAEVLIISNGVRNIDEIRYFTALEWLECSDNQITSLDLSNNTALTWLHCFRNQITSLDLSNNTALTELECYDNQQLTSLDLSNTTALTRLDCYDNQQLTSLDLSNNTALEWLKCSDNQITSLDLSNNTALTWLDCSDNQLTSLDLSNNTALIKLYCYSNDITSLDVSMCRDITTLNCYGRQYDFGFCPLESLKIYKYHIIDYENIEKLENQYGDIIEYVE